MGLIYYFDITSQTPFSGTNIPGGAGTGFLLWRVGEVKSGLKPAVRVDLTSLVARRYTDQLSARSGSPGTPLGIDHREPVPVPILELVPTQEDRAQGCPPARTISLRETQQERVTHQ
jgi:hypothetical protein